ncbi:MAG: hypothetical protein AB7V48_15020 [Sedimentibacter sp.]
MVTKQNSTPINYVEILIGVVLGISKLVIELPSEANQQSELYPTEK